MRRLPTMGFAARIHSFSRICWSARILVTLAFSAIASAQVDIGRDLIGEQLFPPDLILRQAEAIGLSDAQREAVLTLVRDMKKTMVDGRTKLKAATDGLRESLGASGTPEAAAMEKFSALLDIERDLKRAQFAMLLKAKNQLAPEQQEKLRVIFRNQPKKGGDKPPTTDGSPVDVRQELNNRMQKVLAGVDRWRSEGRDPAPLLELIKTFGDQMQSGKFPDAKDTLNKALEKLNEAKPR
jgi:hypothetical protein